MCCFGCVRDCCQESCSCLWGICKCVREATMCVICLISSAFFIIIGLIIFAIYYYTKDGNHGQKMH